MSWQEWVYAHAVVFAAFVIRGLTGFGTALVMAPLLTLVLDLRQTAVITAVVTVANGVGLAYRLRRDAARRELRFTSASSLVGLVIGTYLLVTQPGAALKRAVGVLTVVFAADMLRERHQPPADRRTWPIWIGLPVGLASGILGALFGTSGPPMVVFLARRGLTMAAFRATLIAYFSLLDSARAIGYATTGLVNAEILTICAWMVPTSYAGSFIGSRIHARVSERSIRMAIAVTLLITGLALAIGW